MRSHELMRGIVEKHGAKTLAAGVGLSVPRIHQWAEPPALEGSGTANPLDRVAGLIRTTRDDDIAHWICTHSEGFFVKNAKADDLKGPHLMEHTDTLIQQYTEMVRLIFSVVVDGQVTKDEAANLRTKWQQIQSVTEAYIRECEEGSFRPKPASAAEPAPNRRGLKARRLPPV